VTVEDISEKNRERINDALADLTGGPGGGGEAGPVNEDAIIVSKSLNGRAGFTSIQDAIDGDNAQNGASGAGEDDTIFVEAGDYNESVTVDTKGLTITGTTDPSAGTATVTGQSTAAVDIRANGVTVDRLEVRNPGTQGAADSGSSGGAVGVRVNSGSKNATVRDSVITDIGVNDDDANPIGVLASDGTVGITVIGNEISNLEGTDEDQEQVQGVLVNESGTGITGARVENNTITDLLDTRSTNAVRFNGDVSGEIVGNTISDLNTEGTIPGSGGAPGGFTQVIALQQGGNSTTGPSDVTIENNTISNIETTTADNFAPPFHIIVGSNTSDISITGNELTADSQDTEVFVEDRSSESPSLNEVLNDKNNVFNPEAVAGENRIIPLQTESGGLFANLGADGIAPLQAGTKLSEFPTGSGEPFGLDGEFMQPIYANKTDVSISIDVVSNGFGPTDQNLDVSSYNGAAFTGSNEWTRIPTGSGTPYPLDAPETAWDSSGDFQGGPISGGPDGDYELVEISQTDDGFRVVWEFLGTEQSTAQDAGLSSQTVEREAKQPQEEDAEAY
jgi:hypothetical protein